MFENRKSGDYTRGNRKFETRLNNMELIKLKRIRATAMPMPVIAILTRTNNKINNYKEG